MGNINSHLLPISTMIDYSNDTGLSYDIILDHTLSKLITCKGNLGADQCSNLLNECAVLQFLTDLEIKQNITIDTIDDINKEEYTEEKIVEVLKIYKQKINDIVSERMKEVVKVVWE